MDTLSSDITRFQSEMKLADHAIGEQRKWVEKSQRHQSNLRALMQLIISTSIESGVPVPEEVAAFAGGMGIAVPTPPVKPSVAPPSGIAAAESFKSPPTELDDPELAAHTEVHKGQSTAQLIIDAVSDSGAWGISPPEIIRKLKVSGISMHKNYPYVVLRKAVEDKKIEKNGLKYYRKKS